MVLSTSCLVTSFSLLLCGAPVSSASQPPVEALELNMTSQFYGNVKALVSPIGVKFQTEKMGIDLVARPPDGRIFAFNNSVKTICRVDLNQFNFPGMAKMQNRGNIQNANGKYFRTGRTLKISGLHAIEFANYKKSELPKIKEQRIKAFRSGHPELIVYPMEIWATTDMALPKTFLSIVAKVAQTSEKQLAQLYSNQRLKATSTPIPLRMYRVSDSGRKLLTIDTVSARKTKAASQDFELPKGYKSVSNELQLLIGDADSLDIEPSNQPVVKPHIKNGAPDINSSMLDFAKKFGLDYEPGKQQKK